MTNRPSLTKGRSRRNRSKRRKFEQKVTKVTKENSDRGLGADRPSFDNYSRWPASPWLGTLPPREQIDFSLQPGRCRAYHHHRAGQAGKPWSNFSYDGPGIGEDATPRSSWTARKLPMARFHYRGDGSIDFTDHRRLTWADFLLLGALFRMPHFFRFCFGTVNGCFA
jgi:hypothetical protein